jgi:hypothetical protein
MVAFEASMRLCSRRTQGGVLPRAVCRAVKLVPFEIASA